MARTSPSCMSKSASSPNLSSYGVHKSLSSTSLSLMSQTQPSSARAHKWPVCLIEECSTETTGRQLNSDTSKNMPHLSRRSVLSSVAAVAPSAVKKALNYSAQSTAVWWGTSELVWPIDERTLCEIAETCVKTRTAIGMSRDTNMFFVHHLFQNVVSFYENLFSEGIDKDHFVLRLIYQHIVAVIEHLNTLDVCTEDALRNFDKMRKAMEAELDIIHAELYRTGKSI